MGAHARIRVTWTGGGLTAQDESDEFTIASRIHVTSPNTAVSWAAGATRSVTWTVDAPGLQNFDVDVSTDGGATWTPGPHNIPYSSPTTFGQASMRMPAILTSQALVRVSPAGRPGDGDVSDVPFSLVAPSVTVSNPLGNESWVIGSTHRIRFASNLGT